MEALSSTMTYRTPTMVFTPEGQAMTLDDIKTTGDLLRFHLGRYKAWRSHSDEDFQKKFIHLQQMQVERLKVTHAGLLEDERYKAITEFFLNDLYGGMDLSELAREVERAIPVATRLLPDSVMRTSAVALDLNALTGELDEALTHMVFEVMGISDPTQEDVMEAHRRLDHFEQRNYQMDLLLELGRGLDKYVRSRVIFATFKIAHRPAKMAGLGGLYDFLGRGFEVMRPMGSAEDFLQSFVGKERQIFQNIHDRVPNPFEV
jgi:hypothetical protein